ncbi:MAG: class F sortase [Parcubacteria group bacterium]
MNKKALIGILAAVGVLLVLFLVFSKASYVSNSTSTPVATTTGEITSATAEVENKRWPVRLDIPKLEVEAPMQYMGINAKGNMEDPNNFTDVGWYKLGTIPGNTGSAVMAGHQDNGYGLNGVFKYLHTLKIGDDVYVVNGEGKKLHYRVVETAVYPWNAGPLERIFNAKDGKYLNLITCSGVWSKVAGSNDKRLVVYTELVEN